MMRFPYDATRDPPAPVIMVRLERAPGGLSAILPAIVDTGADCTVAPRKLATDLGLLPIGFARLEGVGGRRTVAPEFSARLYLGRRSLLCIVVGVGDELILGRDVLNRGVLQLEGPSLRGSFRLEQR